MAIERVSKQFGATLALREVTLVLRSARLYCLLGENGAGKSTLLRIIAGLAAPTRGVVTLFGAVAPQHCHHRLGYMPHASLLYDELSGLENLRYFAQLYAIRGDSAARAAMSQVGLDPALARHVGQYSQGMRQRLSLARALVHSPELLLLDEPFSNIDSVSAEHMAASLATMRDAGKTIVVVTHQPQLLSQVADETVLLRAGRVAEQQPAPHRSEPALASAGLQAGAR